MPTCLIIFYFYFSQGILVETSETKLILNIYLRCPLDFLSSEEQPPSNNTVFWDRLILSVLALRMKPPVNSKVNQQAEILWSHYAGF